LDLYRLGRCLHTSLVLVLGLLDCGSKQGVDKRRLAQAGFALTSFFF
jgi:hypothetical protein